MSQVENALSARFWAKVGPPTASGCRPWLGVVDPTGYGQFSIGRRSLRAHRVAYELTFGPIPAGLTIDHVCHNGSGCTLGKRCPHRRCVEATHLEAVPPGVNTRRGQGVAGINARKTECGKCGEVLKPAELGKRRCVPCRTAGLRENAATAREYRNAQAREQYQAHREDRRAKVRERNQARREELNAKSRAYYQAHRQEILERQRRTSAAKKGTP